MAGRYPLMQKTCSAHVSPNMNLQHWMRNGCGLTQHALLPVTHQSKALLFFMRGEWLLGG